MASPIPPSPQPPNQNGNKPFWKGAGATFAILFGLYVLMGIRIGEPESPKRAGTNTFCALDSAEFLVDGKWHPIRSGEARIWKVSNPTIRWSCGAGSPREILPCDEGLQYIVVARFPDKKDIRVRCVYRED